ncbi:MAG: hypothetical protein CVV25_08440 [Ignavibacteriae bacterium HGW-Ignavibacteriae-4]|jgi:hypothetical protein|nr:MAG: hypothetical protein CVV25_08440 [Ignavibacteriae bacterium HGW-Ignavibacteriae-4]
MKKIILIFVIFFALLSCSDDEECREEFALIESISIDTINNNLELRVYYGTGGCDYLKPIDELQTDSSYTVNIIKCVERRNNPDIVCPTVWIEDSLIRNIEIPSKDTFEFVINDSIIKWIKNN